MSNASYRRFLPADVVGYSRLTGADEEGTIGSFRALRAALIDPAIKTNRGRVFHTAGDSILVEFASVVDAVVISLEVQRGIAERNRGSSRKNKFSFASEFILAM